LGGPLQQPPIFFIINNTEVNLGFYVVKKFDILEVG
jgi:hypothetical protein